MARPLRMEYAGALYHCTSRGNAYGRIYFDDADREVFLRTLESVVNRFEWLCHAYCLMDNQYHLLIETPRPNLSRGMRQLNGVYTQKYNFAHKTVGHPFQGRYKAIIVEKEAHLLALSRYVVLNSVRATMASAPQEWKWSSYKATGLSKGASTFLATDWVLPQYGRSRTEAQKGRRDFVREGIGPPSVWQGLVGGIILGAEDFAARCRNLLAGREDLEEAPAQQRKLGRPTLSDLMDKDAVEDRERRDELIYEACVTYEYRLREVASYLGIHYATVSRALKRAEARKFYCKT